MSRRPRSSAELVEFDAALSAFVRDFGLNEPEQTPCTVPIPVADARTLTVVAAGPIPQSALAAELGVSASTVSRVVDRLVQQGWVERRADAHDRRRLLLQLTDAGARMAREMAARRRARHAEVLGRLNADQRRQVVDGLRLLAQASIADASSARAVG